MSYSSRLLVTGLRVVCIPVLAGLAACQSMGSGAEQRAFIAAHIVRSAGVVPDGPIYLAQDGAFARVDDAAPTQVAQADTRP